MHALPRNLVWEHVDDLAQPLTAHSANALIIKLVAAGTIVGEEVQRLRLKLSDKSFVVPISAATQRAAWELGRLTPPVLLRVSNSVDDVGFEMGGGRRRMANTQNKRIRQKARQRARRTRALVIRNRAALKIVRPGVATKQAHGHVVTGASATQTHDMRVNLKGATHFGGTQACITTSVALWTSSRLCS